MKNRVARASVVLTLLTLTSTQVASQTLVADIHPGGSSDPRLLTRAGSRLFFEADDGLHGRELWVSDGTEAGTELVADLDPGPGDSSFTVLAAFGERVLFGTLEEDLWISDGTLAGTQQLAAFDNLRAERVTVVGSRALIEVDLVTSSEPWDRRIWTTDGTPDGTHVLEPLPGPVESLAILGGDAYLVARPPLSSQSQLWRTDGSLEGTVLLETFRSASGLVASGERLYFLAIQPSTGQELWTSNGTEGGAALVVDLTPGPEGTPTSGPYLTPFKDGVIFTAFLANTGWEPCFSDGTALGTHALDLTPGPAGVETFGWLGIGGYAALANGRALFSYDPLPIGEPAIWSTDGTLAGTYPIPGMPTTSLTGALADSVAYYHEPGDLNNGSEGLWITDGETVQAFPDVVMPFNAPPQRVGSGDFVLFSAEDDAHGFEPWIADGTTAELWLDIAPGNQGSLPGNAGRHEFERVGTTLFFTASTAAGAELHAVPFTEVGTFVAEPFGHGTEGSNGTTPRLALAGQPTLGSGMELVLEGALPNVPAVRLFSVGTQPIEVGPGAVLYPAPPLYLAGVLTDAEGAATLSTTLGTAPALVGVALTFQFVASDPGGAFAGIGTLSNALEVVIGP